MPAALRDKRGVHYPLKSSRDCCAAAAGTGLASNPGLSHRTDLFCPRCWVLGRAAKSKVFMAPSESPSASQSYYEDVLWFEMSQRGMLGLLGCWLGLPGLYKILPICFLVAFEFALGIFGIFGVFSIIGTFGIYRILTASESSNSKLEASGSFLPSMRLGLPGLPGLSKSLSAAKSKVGNSASAVACARRFLTGHQSEDEFAGSQIPLIKGRHRKCIGSV